MNFLALALVAFLLLVQPAIAAPDEGVEVEPRYESATVVRVVPGETPSTRLVTVKLGSGDAAGREVTIVQQLSGEASMDLGVAAGDGVLVAALPGEGAEPDYQIADYQRGGPVGWLAAAVALLLLAVGGLRGLKTMAVLGGTLALLAGVLLPLTLRGWPPVPVAIALAAVIGLFTTLLTAGIGRKSWAAVGGTTAAVAIAGCVALAFTGWARLTGVADADLLGHGAGAVDFAGLLAAGMLLGATGVVLDLALSISAAVTELAAENPAMGRGHLRQAGMAVGRDLLSTTANTLLLAYMGGFLPMLLTLAIHPPSALRLAHLEVVGAEAVTVLVGLAGLTLAVPITSWLASLGAARPAA